MKMLVVTSVRDDLRAVAHIMDSSGIAVYSVAETIGHKTETSEYLPDNWFGKSTEGTNALFFFSFTEDEKAASVIEHVKTFNRESNTRFPIRAFVMGVESYGH